MAALTIRPIPALIVIALLTQLPDLAAAEISGPAKVIDGDTIKIRGAKIRLHGIDAPESAQICKAKEKTYRCGTSATLALARRIVGKSVSCDERDRDRYGRIVAVCHADGEDLLPILQQVVETMTENETMTRRPSVSYHAPTNAMVINADPDVQQDLQGFFRRLVPSGDDPSMAWLAHTTEGPDDMPAHIRAALTQTSIGIPVADGRLMLGTWQGIYLFEHRHRPHRREIVLHLTG